MCISRLHGCITKSDNAPILHPRLQNAPTAHPCTYGRNHGAHRRAGVILKEKKVEFKQPDFSNIFNAINNDAGGRYFSEFVKLCSTFINLFKSRGLDSDDMAKEQCFDTMHHF